jgi:hypothetical protein
VQAAVFSQAGQCEGKVMFVVHPTDVVAGDGDFEILKPATQKQNIQS